MQYNLDNYDKYLLAACKMAQQNQKNMKPLNPKRIFLDTVNLSYKPQAANDLAFLTTDDTCDYGNLDKKQSAEILEEEMRRAH